MAGEMKYSGGRLPGPPSFPSLGVRRSRAPAQAGLGSTLWCLQREAALGEPAGAWAAGQAWVQPWQFSLEA